MIGHKIGGEFEINPSYLKHDIKDFNPKGFLFSSGRIALHVILDFLKTKKNIDEILLPEYLCESIIKTSQNNNFKISFYQLDQNFDINRQFFPKDLKNKAILIINYFGLKKTADDIAYIKDNTENCPIILDNVQAFFEMFNATAADFSFASFRKFFPVPDGGWLIVKNENFYFEYSNSNTLFLNKKLLGGILKYFSSIASIEDEIYLKLLEEGEKDIDDNKTITTISKESINILSNLNIHFNEIARQRKVNTIFVLEQLKCLDIKFLFPFNKIINAPLAIPIKIKNRDIIRQRLNENKIYLPVHWPVPIEYSNTLKFGNRISKDELSIIVDQRYSPSILQRIFDVLYQCKEDKIL